MLTEARYSLAFWRAVASPSQILNSCQSVFLSAAVMASAQVISEALMVKRLGKQSFCHKEYVIGHWANLRIVVLVMRVNFCSETKNIAKFILFSRFFVR